MEIEGKSFIEMNIVDADKLGIKNGDKVRVSSRRGSIESTARVGTKTSPGESWMPFHFPDGNANWLTNAALDKYAFLNIRYAQLRLRKHKTISETKFRI
jgi:predicted molibdopterin-dependent oxidoreductase YjgC